MLISRRVPAVALAAAVLLTSAGCSKLRELQQSATGDISQWTAEKVTQAFTAINAKIGADPADYELVIINEYSVSVEAIDPHKRENVDKYKYRGGSVEVAPVDVSDTVSCMPSPCPTNGPGAIEMGAFKGDTVKPEVLAQAMNSAPNDSGVENATINEVMVHKMWANDNAPQISVYVKGPRASKVVFYDLTGRLQKVS
jgi:hypothetical protein